MPSDSAARPTRPRSFRASSRIRSFSVLEETAVSGVRLAAGVGAGCELKSSGPISGPRDRRADRARARCAARERCPASDERGACRKPRVQAASARDRPRARCVRGAIPRARSDRRAARGAVELPEDDRVDPEMRSARNVFFSTRRASRFSCEAAIRRMSTWRSRTSPRRRNFFSSSTFRSFGWTESGTSPISSRKSVPRWATSRRPSFVATAPVKAPFVPEKLALKKLR